MNSLANMYQGGMGNVHGAPTNPRKPFADVQQPVQFPQFGQNQQQGAFAGQPPLGQNNGQFGHNMGAMPNNDFGNNGHFDGRFRQEAFGQNNPNMANFWQNRMGNRVPPQWANNPSFGNQNGGWIGGDLGWPTNGGQNRGW